jgi:hypothetical protein
LQVAEQARVEAEKAVEVVQKRIEALAGAEVRRAELETELATRRNSIPRLEAEVKVKQAALDEAKHDFALEIDTAAAVLGLTAKSLSETVEPDDADHGSEHQVQRWFTINRVEFPATDGGVVESMPVTNGAWVEANTLVATVVQPNSLRFRAVGLQSDLGRLRDGQTAYVVPPQGSGIATAIARRGEPHGSGLGIFRYVVEQALALFHQFRRLRTRFDKRDDIHEAFMDIGCAMIRWPATVSMRRAVPPPTCVLSFGSGRSYNENRW